MYRGTGTKKKTTVDFNKITFTAVQFKMYRGTTEVPR